MTEAAALSKREKRVPCASCKQPIIDGARKCRTCKAWQPEGPRAPRAAIIMAITVTSVFSVIATSQKSRIDEAPPLTALAGDRAASSSEPSPARVGPDAPTPGVPPPLSPTRKFATREIRMGDVHPLDIAFSKSGQSIYVSADDATVREYLVETGEMVHKASVPAKGDRLVLLFDRYLAVVRPDPRVARVPVLDVTKWDRDPVLLEVGAGPVDVLEMQDGSVVVGTTTGHRVSRFALPSGNLLADITLPQSSGQVFLVRAEGRPHLAALGAMTHAGRPAGAWFDLFDPSEKPFGATRRSVAVGHDPRPGGVTSDGSAVFFPDFASNSVALLDIGAQTKIRTADVGQGPIAGFVMQGDRYGVTINATARTASVVDLMSKGERMAVSTLMLNGEPRNARLSNDRSTLFVTLGGQGDPPRGQGVAVIGGDPPAVRSTLATGAGAISVAVAKDGGRAAVVNYFAKSITVLE